MSYYSELCRAMLALSSDERTIFVGQGVGCEGTTMSSTFKDVPADKRLEFPVAEDLQMGFCTGMSLVQRETVPVCIYPRWNFLLCAANQIVTHLDRLPLYSAYRPKVIIRVATPSTSPFYPGPQHDDDFSAAFQLMLRTIDIVYLVEAEDIVPEYLKALNSTTSTILCEFTDFYKDAIAKEAGDGSRRDL